MTAFFTVIVVFLTIADPSKEGEKFFQVGERLYAEGKYKLAADTLARSVAIFERSNRPIDQAKSANLQAECLSNLGQCDVAGALLQKSLEIIGREKDQATLADTY